MFYVEPSDQSECSIKHSNRTETSNFQTHLSFWSICQSLWTCQSIKSIFISNNYRIKITFGLIRVLKFTKKYMPDWSMSKFQFGLSVQSSIQTSLKVRYRTLSRDWHFDRTFRPGYVWAIRLFIVILSQRVHDIYHGKLVT